MEKHFARIVEEIKNKGLSSQKEINAYLKTLEGKSLDDIPTINNNINKAKDLVSEAYEMPFGQAKKLIDKALKLDPNNVDAYNFLGDHEKDIDAAIALYTKGIKLWEQEMGEEFIENEKGYFWGLIETRPYMRAKAKLADCYHVKKDVDKQIEIYQEMLALNPSDNQGVRYLLFNLLLDKEDLTALESFLANSEEEENAAWSYNLALFYFKKTGASAKSNKALRSAFKSNPFVVDLLLGHKKLPKKMPNI